MGRTQRQRYMPRLGHRTARVSAAKSCWPQALTQAFDVLEAALAFTKPLTAELFHIFRRALVGV